MAIPRKKPFQIAANEQERAEGLPWQAYGVSVNNMSAQWLDLGAQRFIGPSSRGTFSLDGDQIATFKWNAPPGVIQPVAVTGQIATLVYTDAALPDAGGPILGAQVAAMAQLERFALANIPTPGNAGRAISVTNYDQSIWLDNGVRFYSVTDEVIHLAAYCALDGITDDTAGFRNAILAAGPGVLIKCPPSKTISISGSLTLNGCSIDLQGSSIRPNGQTFPIFNVTAQLARFNILNMFLDFSAANGGITCTNPLAVGFNFDGAIIGQIGIENVLVQYAYEGYRDTVGGFLHTLRNVQAANCRSGFVKNGGTTFKGMGVYATTCVQAFVFNGAVGCEINGAADSNANGANAVDILSFTLCHALQFHLDIEGNTLTQNGLSAIVRISNCSGFNGQIKSSGNILATGAAGTVPFLRVDTLSHGVINGSYWGTAFGDVASGTGTAYSIYIDGATGANSIVFAGCQIQGVGAGAGPATVVESLTTNTAGQDVTFLACANFAGTVTDAGGRNTYIGMGGSAITRGAVPSVIFQFFVPGIGNIYADSATLVMHTQEIRLASALRAATPAGAEQTNTATYAGIGVPNNANGVNGDFYFRSDGAAGTSIYMKRAGAWVGIV